VLIKEVFWNRTQVVVKKIVLILSKERLSKHEFFTWEKSTENAAALIVWEWEITKLEWSHHKTY